MKKIFGHKDQINLLTKCLKKKNVPQSWILHGLKGLGKFTLIENLIKTIEPDSKSGVSQNSFIINSNNNEASIDDIRTLIKQLSLTNNSDNNSSDKTFVIIDNADELNFNSHNALLKTIEEPPLSSIIVLISHNIKSIPKTVSSRCIKLKFSELCESEFEEFIRYNFPDQIENFVDYYKVSKGIPGILFSFLNSDGYEIKELTSKILEKNNFDANLYFSLEKFIDDKDNFNYNLILNFIYVFLRLEIQKYFNNETKFKEILDLLNLINPGSSEKILVDKKKELHYIFSEFFSLKIQNE
tara:strand:- start:1063 stop:1956 length:894 start_codon:yes stop_codon:yes gene_type:complete